MPTISISISISILFQCLLFILLITTTLSVCPRQCSGHGTCDVYDKCTCFKGRDGYPAYGGYDCALHTCPKGAAWISEVVLTANNIHPIVECSNKGKCDYKSGMCNCFNGYEGLACERTVCHNDCNDQGVCFTQRQMAEEAGREYSTPWDADRHVGCVCDPGFRGVDCSLRECPSGADPFKGRPDERKMTPE